MIQDTLIPTKRVDIEPSLRRNKVNEYFVKGPIPLRWLHQAGALPGKAFTLGLLLFWFYGMNPDRPIKVTRRSLKDFSISEDAYRDGLKRLEEVGLVSVSRSPGQRASIQVNGAKLEKRPPVTSDS